MDNPGLVPKFHDGASLRAQVKGRLYPRSIGSCDYLDVYRSIGSPTAMFLLICRYNRVYAFPGDDITLSSHLSPETSAVPMEVRWFRGTECIYLYKNGQVSVGRGYEGRASLMTSELKRGNVSLVLKSIAPTDTGTYSCQVLTGHNKVEKSIHLYMSGMEPLSPDGTGPKLTEQDGLDMDESVLILELRNLLQQREKELEDKTKQLETTGEMLRTKSNLLLYKDADLENVSREAIRNEERLGDVLRELETCKRHVERLGRDLEEKNAQVEELQGVLKDKERELEEEEEKKQQEKRPEEQTADGPKITAEDSADAEESVCIAELKNRLQTMEKDLADKMERLQSAAGALSEKTERLRDLEKNLQDLAKERDEYVKHVTREMEMCLQELETLGQKLQEKNAEVEELRVVLQAKDRELDEEKKRKANEHQDVPELLQKTVATLSETRQDQLEDLESWIRRKSEQRRQREEDEKAEVLENEFLEYVSAVKELMAKKHETMQAWEKMASVLQDKLEVAETDEERGELGTQMEEALEMQRQSREQIKRLSDSVAEKKRDIEERHKREIEEIRETYGAKIEAETQILKTLLPDVQAYFRSAVEDVWRRYRIVTDNLEMRVEKNKEPKTEMQTVEATDSGDGRSDAVVNGEGEC
ncbi:butyrophilin-like protein 8 isoform X1 [Silurus asotus]|uniref:Butyrophilin-like protein 8 isoform X1 n=1 Tax=Silurus asotus TaxID=30991 RepID=A0AAD5AXS0_SILAS|nr:butyrophilin-like protein 8 isoform X1 [Silurus asotus]